MQFSTCLHLLARFINKLLYKLQLQVSNGMKTCSIDARSPIANKFVPSCPPLSPELPVSELHEQLPITKVSWLPDYSSCDSCGFPKEKSIKILIIVLYCTGHHNLHHETTIVSDVSEPFGPLQLHARLLSEQSPLPIAERPHSASTVLRYRHKSWLTACSTAKRWRVALTSEEWTEWTVLLRFSAFLIVFSFFSLKGWQSAGFGSQPLWRFAVRNRHVDLRPTWRLNPQRDFNIFQHISTVQLQLNKLSPQQLSMTSRSQPASSPSSKAKRRPFTMTFTALHQCIKSNIPFGKLTWLWKISIFYGETHYKWQFSIAMLVYQRVKQPTQRNSWWCCENRLTLISLIITARIFYFKQIQASSLSATKLTKRSVQNVVPKWCSYDILAASLSHIFTSFTQAACWSLTHCCRISSAVHWCVRPHKSGRVMQCRVDKASMKSPTMSLTSSFFSCQQQQLSSFECWQQVLPGPLSHQNVPLLVVCCTLKHDSM